MQMLISLFTMFSGPIGTLIEKGVLAAVMYAAGKGWIAGDLTGIAAALYAAISSLFTGVINSQTGKIVAVNKDDNGVKVVSLNNPAQAVNAPQK